MKIKVLTNNTVLQSQNFLGEHGLCLYIEADNKKILLDTGYSDVFLKNAQKMGINLLDLDFIVLSHGHYDHTWGLNHYLPFFISNIKQKNKHKIPTLVTHPYTLNEKYEQGLGEIGCTLSEQKLRKNFDLKLTKEPFFLTENLLFLGEIPRLNDFEAKSPIAKVKINEDFEDDYILEDSALAYKTSEGLIIITGCSHSGICNIIEHAKKLSNEQRILDVVGGFHLVKSSNEKLEKTVKYLKKQNPKQLHPCHCVDFDAQKFLLMNDLPLKPIGIPEVVDFNS